MTSIQDLQRQICAKNEADFFDSPSQLKVGISLDAMTGASPINGLRHPPEGDTTGWYIWAGETLSDDPDHFRPLHVEHLVEIRPEVLKFLGLPPGWRFLKAGDYEDVWQDATLLDI